jgi:hypothetical protein
MKLLNIAVTWLLGMALVIPLVGCEGERQNVSIRATSEFKLSELMRADVVPVSPEQVSEAFALGSDSTDLQREILRKELIGKVIEWDVRVYEIDYADGVYKVTSQPNPIKSKQAVNMLRASLSVYPQDERDHDLLRKAKTNDRIIIRGKVKDIVLRTVVLIEPAILIMSILP